LNGMRLAYKVAEQYQSIPGVETIALGGSQTGGTLDQHSDIDLYVYSKEIVPLVKRQAIVEKLGASKADLNLTFWDTGDEWFDRETGLEVDVMYWDPAWVAGQLNRVWREHQASLGYTTCLWYTVRNSRVLYDRRGWFEALQQHSAQPYPEPLRQAIVAKNHAVLRNVIPSYAHQIEKASRRADRVSQNHRLAALLASYFDVVFALNRALHPGEKRLVAWAQANCAILPVEMAESIEKVLQAAYQVDGSLLAAVYALIDSLDDLLWAQGFDPTTSQPFA